MSAPPREAPRHGATLPRLGLALRTFAGSEVRGRAAALAAVLLALLVAINALNVLNSYVGRDFMTAIEHRDMHGFVQMALRYVAVFAALTVAGVVYRFTEERLGLLWREWLTRRLVRLYLGGRLYHRLEVANPDQRIADDVRSLTTSTLSLLLVFLNGTFTIVAFSGVLWSISPPLFGVAVGYAIVGSALAVLLGRPLVRLNYDQSDRDADFRAALVHVRENVESIALLHREPLLLARLHRLIDAFAANMRRMIAVNRNLGFFTTGYNYMIQLIPALIVAPLFIGGTAEFGVIAQSSIAFAHVVGAFSLVITQFPQLSSYGAVLERLTALVEGMEAARCGPAGGVTIVEDDGRFALEGLTLRTSGDGRVLVRDLSLEVPPGRRVLVTASGEAITALQRAVAGLWEAGDGRVVRPGLDDVMLLPERPYLPPGTLREVLRGERSPGGGDLDAALRALSLDDVVHRAGGLDVERDWDDTLSLEELRLLELARILVARPRFAVLARLASGIGVARATVAREALAAAGIGLLLLAVAPPEGVRFEAAVAVAPDGAWTRIPAMEVGR